MMFNNLGERIACLRKERNLTQQDLAEKVGISRTAMVKVENSQRIISIEEGNAISSALGINIDTLLDYEKIDHDEKSFVRAFKSKGKCNEQQEIEIKTFEMLFDSLCTQELIYRGE